MSETCTTQSSVGQSNRSRQRKKRQFGKQALPSLYVDDRTIIQEVDVRHLRKGDHCIVGLSLVRQISPLFDKFFALLASWEVFQLYHHFIMVDDVWQVDSNGTPLTKEGNPAMVCEYSNTVRESMRTMSEHGLLHLIGNLCVFRVAKLSDYEEAVLNQGIFQVAPNHVVSDEERDQIVTKALAMTKTAKSYNPFTRNCEHAAFYASKHSGAWVSPQVSWILWNGFRFGCQLVGVHFLLNLAWFPSSSAALSHDKLLFADLKDTVTTGVNPSLTQFYWLAVGYHTFATLPVLLQALVSMCRTVVFLRSQRKTLNGKGYCHLMSKEIGRGAWRRGCLSPLTEITP